MSTFIYHLLELLKVSDPQTLGNLVAKLKCVWTLGHSARVQAQKLLNKLVSLNQIIRGSGWYAVKGYKGNYGAHDQAITQCLAKLLALYPNSQVKREVSLPKGLRSDAIVLLTQNNQGLCLILEVALNERPEFLNQKLSTWESWEGATEALSQIFQVEIPSFIISVESEDAYELEGRAVSFTNLINQIGGA